MTVQQAQELFAGLPVTLVPGMERGAVEVVFPAALTFAVRARIGDRCEEWRDGAWRPVRWTRG